MVELRRTGMASEEIAAQVGVPRSTVARWLKRAGLGRLRALAAPEPVRRYVYDHPGELLHLDVKKLGHITEIGHRITGDRRGRKQGAGWSSYADNKARPVIFRGGAIVDLGTLGGNDGSAWGINDLGRTVGYSLTGDGRWHAFLHRRGVLYDLNDLIPANAGVELIAATAIDDLGRIVGFGCFGGQLAGRDCSGGQLRAVLLTPPFGQMLQDLIELLNRLGPRGGRANSLRATLESADRCVGRGDAACLRGPLTAFAEELQAQAGEALTEEHARLLAAAVDGLRATQEYREPEGVPARERE